MKSTHTHHSVGFNSGGYFHNNLSVFLLPKFPENVNPTSAKVENVKSVAYL